MVFVLLNSYNSSLLLSVLPLKPSFCWNLELALPPKMGSSAPSLAIPWPRKSSALASSEPFHCMAAATAHEPLSGLLLVPGVEPAQACWWTNRQSLSSWRDSTLLSEFMTRQHVFLVTKLDPTLFYLHGLWPTKKAPLFIGIPKQVLKCRLPFPSLRGFPDSGLNTHLLPMLWK